MSNPTSAAGKAALLNKLTISEEDARGSSGQSRWPLVTVAVTVLFTLMLGVVFLFKSEPSGVSSASSQPPSATAKPTETTVSEQLSAESVSSNSNLDPILNASGYVTARLMATVSAEVMGRLISVEVEEGQGVNKGQVLARLDDSLAKVDWQLSRAQNDVVRARLAGLQSDLRENERVLKRIASLGEASFSSESELTSAKARVDKIKTEIQASRSELRVSEYRAERQKQILDDHTIRAPFTGVVTVKNAQPGEIVAPSSAGGGFTRTGICTIVDMGSLEIEVDVNEAYIGRVFEDQKVLAQLDAYPKWDIPAAVIAIIPTADRSKATVRVRVKLLVNDDRILPDMGVKVAFFSIANTEDS